MKNEYDFNHRSSAYSAAGNRSAFNQKMQRLEHPNFIFHHSASPAALFNFVPPGTFVIDTVLAVNFKSMLDQEQSSTKIKCRKVAYTLGYTVHAIAQ